MNEYKKKEWDELHKSSSDVNKLNSSNKKTDVGGVTQDDIDKADKKQYLNQDKYCDYIRNCLSIYKNVLLFSNDPYASITGWELIKFLLFFIDKILEFFKKQMAMKEDEILRKQENYNDNITELERKLENEKKKNMDANEILYKEIETKESEKQNKDNTIINLNREQDVK